MKTLPAGLAAEIAKQGRSLQRFHLLDVQTWDGQTYFWSDFEGTFPGVLAAGTQTYKPWLKQPPTIKRYRSQQADGGDFSLQNLSGNTIDREVAALIKAREFEGAYCVYRRWFSPLEATDEEFHATLTEQDIGDEEIRFRLTQVFQPNDISAADFRETLQCHFRFTSAQCGYRRAEAMLGLTTATIFSANTIGAGGLSMTPDLYKDELVMILTGTGAGQERYISTHTATTATLKSNWTTAPDGTSQFVIVGPGTMIVSPQLADIFSSNTIGKTGLGRGVDADKGHSVAILSGTGAGQKRQIASNTATTYTVTPNWTTAPDGTSRFVVIYRTCSHDLAACTARGVPERFPGIVQLHAGLTQIVPRFGGGCPLSGAPVKLYGDPADWAMRVQPCEEFIELLTETGRKGTFSRPDKRYCRRGLLAVWELVSGDLMLTDDGEERLVSAKAVHIPGATVDSYEARKGHIYSAWGFIGHNVKDPMTDLGLIG